jgi:hypothetical protein
LLSDAAELYRDVVDGVEEGSGVPSRLLKTEVADGRQEARPTGDVPLLAVGQDAEGIAVSLPARTGS